MRLKFKYKHAYKLTSNRKQKVFTHRMTKYGIGGECMSITNLEVNELSRSYLIDRKSRVIFIRSEASKKEPFLYEFILKNVYLSAQEIDEQLQNLSEEQIIIINDLLPSILKMCKDEWKGDEVPAKIILKEEDRINCSLCNAKNRDIFFIVNKLNGNKLNVGSTCIQEFSTITLQEGKSRSALLREAMKVALLRKLTLEFPGIQKEVEDWNNKLNYYEILIPKSLEEEYLSLGEKFRQLFDEYLSNNETSYENFEEIFKKKNKILGIINEYVQNNKDEKWVVNKIIVDWLRRNNKHNVIEKLKETGYITSKIAEEIEEVSFLEYVRLELNKHLDSMGLEIIKVDTTNNTNFIICSKKNGIKLECRTNKFISYFGSVVFNDENNLFKPINIFKVSNLQKESDIQQVLNQVNGVLISAKANYRIYDGFSHYNYFEKNELDILDNTIMKIRVIELREFINCVKHLIFDFQLHERLISEIDKHMEDYAQKKKYTVQELKSIRDI